MTDQPDETLEHTQTSAGGPLPAASGAMPASIGPYRIIGKLGEGGMGVVYEAEQLEPKRRVALKVIRGGTMVDDVHVRMFAREAETLARLKHPNIGAIYEAGRTEDGMHWFAMELVRGRQLDEYLASRPAVIKPEELRHRLRLVASIARAVHHAHQRGVIHRDIKPSNIIVTDATRDSFGTPAGLPEVKILDFGLARLTDEDIQATQDLTAAGAIKGTLPYMSPEQARGEIESLDVRTDIYSLGVLLYEALTGKRPYDVGGRSLLEAVRVICETSPRSLSGSWSGARRLDRDIETIVETALEKKKERRYGSAAALAEDLERHLTSQPIMARPPSAAYQARKFAQRHRSLVLGASAVLLAVIAGLVTSTTLYLRAEHEKKVAQQASKFLSSMLEGVGAEVAQGRDTTLLKGILASTTARIGEELADDPEIEAQLRSTMGIAYYQISELDEADRQLERSLELYQAERGDQVMNVAQLHASLGMVAQARGEHELAERRLREATAVALQEEPEGSRLLRWQAMLADALVGQARYDDARVLLLEVLESQRRLFGGVHEDVATTLNRLGNVFLYLGDVDQADEHYGQALAMHRELLGDEHPFVATDLMNTAQVLKKRGEFPEAEAVFRDALARFRKLYPEGNTIISVCLGELAAIRRRAGNLDEAESFLREALAIDERIQGERSESFARSLDHLGQLVRKKGDVAESNEMMSRALAIRREVVGNEHPAVASSLNNLAMYLYQDQRFAEAEEMLAEAVEIQRGAAGPDAQAALTFMTNLGRSQDAQDKLAAAEANFREALERRRRILGDQSPFVALSGYYLGRLLRETRRVEEAEPLLRESAAIATASMGESDGLTFVTQMELCEALVSLGRPAEAEELARDLNARGAARLGPGSWVAHDSMTLVAKALSAAGRNDEALAIVEEILAREDVPTMERANARITRGLIRARTGSPAEGRREIEAVQAMLAAKYVTGCRACRTASNALAALDD